MILDELDRLVDLPLDDDGEEREEGGIDEILSHIKAVERAVEFIDRMTTNEANSPAFEAEVSLRKALEKMKELADETYKELGDEEEEGEEM
jgi:hypothetical protein